MGPAITYYIVNGEKLDYPSYNELTIKPSLPKIQNFKALKDFVEMNTGENEESEIVIDTDKSLIT
jgi:hypothetical protein